MLVILSISYLIVLFAIAYWGEHQARKGKSLVYNPYVFSLSLTVYCTAWTYYGSVGRAAQSGVDFLTIYIGPSLALPLWWIIMRKIIRICKTRNITSIADFISYRYGKSSVLGVLVTVLSLLGIIPYIALQLKAVSVSFNVLAAESGPVFFLNLDQSYLFEDSAFYVMLVMALFTILFGTRSIEASERHDGIVTAIAFESIVKLLAFLAIGIFVSYELFDGIQDIFAQARARPELSPLFQLSPQGGMSSWFFMSLSSILAFMFLPRQFQVTVVENVDPRQLNKAIWVFPLYLFLINFFVIPIAMAGRLVFEGVQVDADLYVLTLPLREGNLGLAILAYLGGVSAATSMIIVSTTALSVMLSNNLIMPALVSIPLIKRRYTNRLGQFLIYIRRICILLVLHLSYTFEKTIAQDTALVSIGLISFVAISQFAPSMVGGIYWKRANRMGAQVGLILGFLVWFYCLVFPTLINAGYFTKDWMEEGLLGLSLLRPFALFGLDSLDAISHALFWSLLFNTSSLVGLSLLFPTRGTEANQAEVFVNIEQYSSTYEGNLYGNIKVRIPDIESLLKDFLGPQRGYEVMQKFKEFHGEDWLKKPGIDVNLMSYAEKILSGAIGVAASKIVLASIAKEEEGVQIEEVYRIVKESQQLIQLNQQLREKSDALERSSVQLQDLNERLQASDNQKNEFISTITHEMRTPLTSIRAFSEILYDNDEELDTREKQQFLKTIIKETNRMERLINQVLDLEKFESGTMRLDIQNTDLHELVKESLAAVYQLMQDKAIRVDTFYEPNLPEVPLDRDRVLQVLINLLSNAIKFSPKDSGIIRVQTLNMGDYVQISVWDNGKGISPELKEIIFEKFFQAKNQNIRKPKGSGLGLAISKKIIQYHRGKIWVDSQPSEYSCFYIELPLNQVGYN